MTARRTPPGPARTIDLRDQLTIQRLRAEAERAAASSGQSVEVTGFRQSWWSGTSHDPCLLLRRAPGRAGRRRIVETGGETVELPYSSRAAVRELAARRSRTAWRLAYRPELGVVPLPRAEQRTVVLDAEHDAIRCGTRDCGAMRPAAEPGGRCPVCRR